MKNHKCKGHPLLQCPTCEKTFKCLQGKYKHMRNVTCKPVEDKHYITTTTNNNITNNNNNNINNDNSQNSHNKTINNNNNHIVNNNNTIHINAFGSENYDYLFDENNVLKKIINGQNAFMQKFVEAVHFNEDHPENHNIVLTNLQSKHMMIYDGDQFMKVMKDKTIDQLITDKKNIILSNIQKFDLSEEQEKNLKSKMKRLQYDQGALVPLKEKCELICYNGKMKNVDSILN